MSNQGGGKIRPRRTYSTKKPYARPKSTGLIGRVKDTLSHFTPSWLSNMWTPATTNTENVVDNEEVEDEVQQNRTQSRRRVSFEGLESPISANTSQMGSRDYRSQRRTLIATDTEFKSPVQVPFTRYQPYASSTPIEGEEEREGGQNQAEKEEDSNSDESVSTSGCSSLVPHVDKTDYKERTERQTGTGHEAKKERTNQEQKRSLWSDISVTSANTSILSTSGRRQPLGRSSTKPSFNTSYFGAPSFAPDSITPPVTPGGSSFYPGRTSFGGASSQRSSSVKRRRTSPHEIYKPVKRPMRPKPVNNTSEDYGMTSMTAKRILDTIEKMSTPLSDARRIPLVQTSSPMSFTPSGRSVGRNRTPGGSFLTPRGASTRMVPPVFGIKTPTAAKIGKNRQPAATLSKPTDKEVPLSTKVSTKDTDKPSGSGVGTPTTSNIVSPPTTTTVSRSGGKMKTKSRSNLHYSAGADDIEQVEQPDLPADIPLPLPTTKALPTFDFQVPNAATISSTITSASMSTLVTSTPMAAPVQPQTAFKFSSPIAKEPADDVKPDLQGSAQTTFQFSAPKPTPVVDNNIKTSSLFAPQDTSPFSAIPKVQKPKVEEESFSGGMKPAKELKSGSCLEVFGILSNKKSDSSSKESEKTKAFSGFGQKTSKTEEITVIDDDDDDDEEEKSGSSNQQTSVWDKFKPAAGSWSCSACMITNKSNDDKCIACGEAKPGARPQTQTAQFSFGTSAKSSSSSSAPPLWGAKLAPGTWECPGCLVQNKPNITKCPCCGESKPGTTVTSTSAKFGTNSTMSLAEQFKPPAGSWECTVCCVRNNSDAAKCVACGESKPGAKQTSSSSQFSFGAPTNSTTSLKISFGFNAASEKSSKSDSLESKSTTGDSSVWDKYKAPPGSWECDVCMVGNKESDKKCVACLTPKPGTQPSLASPPKSSFSFGAPVTLDNKVTTASSGIVFGKPNNSNTSESNSAISTNETAKTGISFGFPQTSQPDKPKPSITLGTGMGTTPLGAGITFGTVKPNTQVDGAVKSSTGFQASGVTNTSTSLGDGLKSDSSVGSGGFTFGAQKGTDSAATGFVFGQKKDAPSETKSEVKSQEPKVESGGFKLGTSVAPFKFGDSNDKAATTQGLLGTTTAVKKEDKPPAQGTATMFQFSGSNPTGTPVTASSSTGFTPSSFTATPVTASSSTGFTPATDNKSNELKNNAAFMFSGNTTASQPTTTPATSGFNFTSQTKTEPQKTITATQSGGLLTGGKATDTSGVFAFSAGPPNTTVGPAGPPNATVGPATQNKPAVAPFQFSAGTSQPLGGTPNAAPATSQNSTATFGFGQTGTSAFPTTQANTFSNTGFSFATSSKPAATTTATTGGFGFAAPAAATTTAAFSFSATPAPASATTSTPAPAFGAGASTTFGSGFSAPNAFGNSTTSTSASGGFGSISAGMPASTAFPSATPAFGATAGQQNTTTAFGSSASQPNTTAATFGAPSQPSANTGFSFNANQGTNFGGNSGVFQFSGGKDATPVAQVGAGVGFTAPQATANPTVGGFNASTVPPQPSFNFGASTPAPSGTFNFSAGQPTGNNPFSASGSVAGRKIKRPVRRRK